MNNDGWTLLVTADKTVSEIDSDEEDSPAKLAAQSCNHYVITLHHQKSSKAVSFGAICGTFRAGTVLLAWLRPVLDSAIVAAVDNAEKNKSHDEGDDHDEEREERLSGSEKLDGDSSSDKVQGESDTGEFI